MDNYYIGAIKSASFGSDHGEEAFKVPVGSFTSGTGQTAKLGKGDFLLVSLESNGSFEAIEPAVYRVEGVTNKNVTFSQRQSYLESAPFDRVRPILNRGLVEGFNPVSIDEFQKIQALMGALVIGESELLDHIKDYIPNKGIK